MVQSALTLATNPNGVLLLNWLLDESALPGRYRILASKFAPRAAFLINQKPAQGILSRIVQQTVEPEALDLLAFEGLCAREETLASAVLNTPRPRDDGSGYPSEVSAGLFLKLLQAYDEQGRREECRRLATRLDKVLRKYVPHVVEAAHHLGAQDRVRQLVMAVAAFL